MVAIMVTTLFSGCVGIDWFLPQKDEAFVPTGDGMVRVWVAAKPGALGPEFAHYNISFGWMGLAEDIFMAHMVPMRSLGTTADLVELERDKQAKLLGEVRVPPGEYHGFAVTTTGAKIGLREVVGNDNGRPITTVEERVLPHRTTNTDTPTPIRVGHLVASQVVTDLYLEVDLSRSLMAEEGELRHRTVPYAVSVYVQGKKAARELYDGGVQAAIDRSDGKARGYGGQHLDTSRFSKPWSEIDIYDPVTEKQLYSGSNMPSKRLNRAVGLHEDLRFDGTDSISYVMDDTGRQPIVRYDWDFGDGTTARGPSVMHNYTEGGLYEVQLTVRDGYDLVGHNFMTLFVPYTADQAVATRDETRTGQILVGNAANYNGDLYWFHSPVTNAEHSVSFPGDLEGGDLRLGGYRVTLEFTPVGGSAAGGVTSMRLRTDSGHFEGNATGISPVVLETGGMPVWRGPLNDWVSTDLDIGVELITGAVVDYEVIVEALYYGNLSRGIDPHPMHRHGDWPFGPMWDHLEWDGTLREDETRTSDEESG